MCADEFDDGEEGVDESEGGEDDSELGEEEFGEDDEARHIHAEMHTCRMSAYMYLYTCTHSRAARNHTFIDTPT